MRRIIGRRIDLSGLACGAFGDLMTKMAALLAECR